MDASTSTPYDYESVMHAEKVAFKDFLKAPDPNVTTIELINCGDKCAIEPGQRKGLSRLD